MSDPLKRVSAVAWQHINFYGRYQFDADFTPIDFARLRQQLSSEEVSRLYAAQNPQCRFLTVWAKNPSMADPSLDV